MTEHDGYPEDFPWDGSFLVRDIQRKPWWPYRPIDGEVDALWILGDDAKPEGVFGDLLTKWGASLDWFIAGMSLYPPEAEPSSWTAQYRASTIARLERLTYHHDFFPCSCSMEWWHIAPEAEELYDLLQGPLLHPSAGWWLAASADADAGARFVKATMGLLWWARRDYRPYQGRTLEVVDDSVIEALLGLLPQIGLMSVVPLNNHPVSGVVLFGTPEAMQHAASSVGGLPESQGDEVVRLWHRACWLATL